MTYAHKHASYPGNVEHMVGQRVGPNTLGEWLVAVSADYDPAADRTRVGFVFAPAASPSEGGNL